jgi:uncharacterized membrane protein
VTTTPVIGDPLGVLLLLLACVAASEWLGQRGLGRRLGPGILVIVLGAALGNLGLVPSASSAPPIYDAVFRYLAPLSIFFLLLDVRLSELRRVGWPMLLAFLLGTAGTLLGVLAAVPLTNLRAVLGARAGVVAGMYTGTYIGGSSNFNAIALHYDVVKDGLLFAGATAVDASLGTAWIVVILAMPSLLRRFVVAKAAPARSAPPPPAPVTQGAPLDVPGLTAILILGGGSLYASLRLADGFAALGVSVPSILILTTFALLAAQVDGLLAPGLARTLGQFAAYLFLAVVGVHCELASVRQLGQLAPTLLAFVTITLVVHGLVLAGGGILLGLEPEVLAMGSNATVMGATTAPAVAESIGRHDLVLSGILTGSLGNALGTYLGFLVVYLL